MDEINDHLHEHENHFLQSLILKTCAQLPNSTHALEGCQDIQVFLKVFSVLCTYFTTASHIECTTSAARSHHPKPSTKRNIAHHRTKIHRICAHFKVAAFVCFRHKMCFLMCVCVYIGISVCACVSMFCAGVVLVCICGCVCMRMGPFAIIDFLP